MYGSEGLVENLKWSLDRIMESYKDNTSDKVVEKLVATLFLESGVPLVLKMMLDIHMGNLNGLNHLIKLSISAVFFFVERVGWKCIHG